MLKGARLTLRAIERDDLPRFVTWVNDPEVIHHLRVMVPLSLEDETAWYEQQRQDKTTLNFSIVITADNTHIGSIGLMKIDQHNQQAELGILVGDKSKWGQGYGPEAIGLMVDFAFRHLNLHRVYLLVDASHPKAVRAYRTCGFVEEGRLRDNIFRHGRFEDHLIMSILRSEYLK
ncbi:MAG: GNAT family N-acetyltransferase [Anaerolineae bacterium]|nr:GNAT family N-acetyltransferase [Anaerolineae bacterium]